MNTTSPIVATLLSDDARLNALPKLFGMNCVRVENKIYDMLGKLSADYDGAYWEFYELSNGAFYMAPKSDEKFFVSCENMYEGHVSADAAGLIACLYVFNAIACQTEEDKYITLYHDLLDFVRDHAESTAIRRAID